MVHRPNVSVSHEAETTRTVCSLILKDHDVVNLTELLEILTEGGKFEVVWKTANEDFSELGIDLIMLRKEALRDF